VQKCCLGSQIEYIVSIQEVQE